MVSRANIRSLLARINSESSTSSDDSDFSLNRLTGRGRAGAIASDTSSSSSSSDDDTEVSDDEDTEAPGVVSSDSESDYWSKSRLQKASLFVAIERSPFLSFLSKFRLYSFYSYFFPLPPPLLVLRLSSFCLVHKIFGFESRQLSEIRPNLWA